MTFHYPGGEGVLFFPFLFISEREVNKYKLRIEHTGDVNKMYR